MSKKVLIVSDSMVCGGVEKSLLSLLSAIAGCQVDLVLARKTGSLLGSVPASVCVKELPLTSDGRYEWQQGTERYLVALLISFRWLRAIRVLCREVILRCVYRRGKRRVRSFLRGLASEATERWPRYDVAIAYADTPEMTAFVAERVRAVRKIAWLHNDHPASDFDRLAFIDVYRIYDQIVACSGELTAKVSELFAPWGQKVVYVPHMVDREAYEMLADESRPLDGVGGVVIASVGRVCRQKGFDIAIEVCARLRDRGIDVKWYIVGDGPDAASLKQVVAERGLSDAFHFVGFRSNPYPYIKGCNIYVQPSRYEGYCLALAESLALCKPVVSTDFVGAKEQVVDGETGFVVGCNVGELTEAVGKLAADTGIRERFTARLRVARRGGDGKARLRRFVLGDE